jgi:DNA-binding PadR family transcriptional regulator
MAKPTDFVQGTLDLLILKTISLEAKHGWAIAKRIQQVSQEALQIQQGSLYPALHCLEQQAWIKAEWRPTETGRISQHENVTENYCSHPHNNQSRSQPGCLRDQEQNRYHGLEHP